MAVRGSAFKFDTGNIPENLVRLDAETQVALGAVVNRQATLGEARMKVNAPWSDDTGFARVSLHTEVRHVPGKYTIIFAHGANYGIWLEIKQSGKYEIIMPTVRKTGRAIEDDLAGLWGKM